MVVCAAMCKNELSAFIPSNVFFQEKYINLIQDIFELEVILKVYLTRLHLLFLSSITPKIGVFHSHVIACERKDIKTMFYLP